MEIAFTLGEWLLVLALIGFICVTAWLVVTALHFKDAAVRSAKRLSNGPIRSGKNLAAAGKGVVQQESLRAKRIGATVKTTAGVVKESATEVKAALQSIHPDELKSAMANAQETLRFTTNLLNLLRAASKQGT